MTEYAWYKDGNATRLFIHLLLTADSNGCRMCSIRGLASEVRMSVQSIRTSLKKLSCLIEVTHKPTHEVTHGSTIITICNYDNYKISDSAANTLTNTRANTQKEENTPTPLKEEIFSLKKETPKGVKKGNLSSSPKAPKPSPQPLSLPYNSPRFVEVWETLRIQPKWKGKTQTALQLSLNKLAKYDEAFSISLMEDAIERNWQGVVFGDTDERYRQWKTGGKKPKPTKLDQYREVAIQLGLINGTDESNTVDEQ